MLVLKNIAQVVTLQGGPAPRCGDAMSQLGIVENGAILIQGERIRWVGPTRDLPSLEPAEEHPAFEGRGLDLVALPGFVDSHTHAVFAGTRAAEYELRS